MPPRLDSDLLGAALIGYQEKLKEIDSRIADVRRRLGEGLKITGADAAPPVRKKRRLSREGRARIIAATKKRWAAVRQAKADAAAKPAGKAAAKKVVKRKAAKKARAVKRNPAPSPAAPPPAEI